MCRETPHPPTHPATHTGSLLAESCPGWLCPQSCKKKVAGLRVVEHTLAAGLWVTRPPGRTGPVPFVTGPYCDINPLYLANTSCAYSCSRCWSWVDLEVNRCWSVPILYIKKFPPTHPGEVDCRPPLAVWCVFASAIEQYSPSQKDSVRRA